MAATPGLVFRPLAAEELPLALSLAASMTGLDDPKREAWGVGPQGASDAAGEAWGIFEGDILAGAAWLSRLEDGALEVGTFALPRRRWGMGLLLWTLDNIVRNEAQKALELRIHVDGGGPSLGELLEDAGFSGPDVEDEGYPKGDWVLNLLGTDEPELSAPSDAGV